jgi:polo-like kinase 1
MKRRNQQLSVPEVQYFMKQLTDAVSYLHDNSIIHRDLKLDNVFLDETLNVKVGDFGLATRLNNPFATRTEQCGTLQYMAPEVVGQRRYSFSVDIWSMGVILYQLLVGKLPFQASQRDDNTQWRILTNDFSFPSDVHISQDAKDLISSMLHADPDQRPSLYEISRHPFLSIAGAKIPTWLPLSALDQSPVWQIDENGTFVAIEPSNDVPVTFEDDEYYDKKYAFARRPTAPTVEETEVSVTFSQFCLAEGLYVHRAVDVPQRSKWSGWSVSVGSSTN